MIEEVDADEQSGGVACLHLADDHLRRERTEDDHAKRDANVRGTIAAVDDRRTHTLQAVQADAQTLASKDLNTHEGTHAKCTQQADE